MQPVDTIRRRKLYEELAERLERMILDGQFAAGDPLPSERELMERFGVGRPSVRQALFVLQKSGLVEVSSGERARVSQPEVDALVEDLSSTVRYFFTRSDGVHHFREVRQLFEGALVRHAAKHATAEDIEDLRATLERCEAALGRPMEFYEAAESFHRRLAEVPGNPVFVVVEVAIAEWLKPLRQQVGGTRDVIALEGHKRVFEAIVARDPDRAEAEMVAHLGERSETMTGTSDTTGPEPARQREAGGEDR